MRQRESHQVCIGSTRPCACQPPAAAALEAGSSTSTSSHAAAMVSWPPLSSRVPVSLKASAETAWGVCGGLEGFAGVRKMQQVCADIWGRGAV